MRTLVFLSAIAIAAGQDNELKGTCLVDGAEAVSDALDASMFIWASIARCGNNGETVKCEIGVSSAITSINSMVNVILGAVNKCSALNTLNKDCGLAIAIMTKHAGGITSASGGITQKCFQGAAHGLNWNHADAAECVVDVKNTAKNLFKVIKSFMKLEGTQACAGGDDAACTQNALQIIGAFAGVGEYLAGAVGQCSPSGAYKGSVCAEQATRLAQQLTDFSERAVDVSRKCATFEPPRLYFAKGKPVEAFGSSTNIILAAFLPLTAIVGFVGGRFYGLRRTTRGTREVLTDDEFEI